MLRIAYGLGGLGRIGLVYPCSAWCARRFVSRARAGRTWTGDAFAGGAATNRAVEHDADGHPRHGWLVVTDTPDSMELSPSHCWCPICGRLVVHWSADAQTYRCRAPGQIAGPGTVNRCAAPSARPPARTVNLFARR
jgi:hypothetical protein